MNSFPHSHHAVLGWLLTHTFYSQATRRRIIPPLLLRAAEEERQSMRLVCAFRRDRKGHTANKLKTMCILVKDNCFCIRATRQGQEKMASAQASRGNSNQPQQQNEDQDFEDVDTFQAG